MNAILQADLDRLDTALSALTNSITAYNPSLTLAQDLLAADAVLAQHVDELVTHQRNHARLQARRRTADTLAQQLRTALADLASARTDIRAAGRGRTARPPPPSHRGITPTHLLAHAHAAARFGPPPGFVPPTAAGTGALEENGNGQSAEALGEEAPMAPDTSQNPALASLEPGLRAWLDPITQIPFTPWPSNDMVARSGLARVQGWSGAVDVEAESAAAATAAAGQPGNQGKGETEAIGLQGLGEQKDEARRVAETNAKPAAAQTHAREEKPRVFMGMELLGSDEE